MKINEKISILILIVLVIILALTIWVGQKDLNPVTVIDCGTACHSIGNVKWILPGDMSKFSTKEACVSACLARTQK
ncbi:MAG: hypothetical protein NT155_03005 [Candidatus Staskawiczbacteria bacterium]|nr:hypothetical protein [Candidatus Staskawiczbacteria bacterium]